MDALNLREEYEQQSGDALSDAALLEILQRDPERIKRLIASTDGSSRGKENESGLPPLPPPKKKKSKKADIIEKHIKEVLLPLYNSRYDITLQFHFDEPINSLANTEIFKSWRALLLLKKPEEYNEEAWIDARLNSRIKALFWAKKQMENKTDKEKEKKRDRDRRANRLSDKCIRRTRAIYALLDKKIVSKDVMMELSKHVNCPSDEETDTENENGAKKIKVAQATYRSEELIDYYKMIDDQRSASKKGGENSGAQRLERIPWVGRIHSPPPNPAAWTLKPSQVPSPVTHIQIRKSSRVRKSKN